MIQLQIQKILNEALNGLVKSWNVQTSLSCMVDVSQDPKHGDFSTNIAMILAKSLTKKPYAVAEAFIEQLNTIKAIDTLISQVSVAGPGFINISVAKQVYYNEMLCVIEKQKNYGRSDMGKDQKICLEFVSANPTGPLHVGHGRGAVIGDVLATILAYAGYEVVREYYLNDCGNQMHILGKTARAWKKSLASQEKPAFLQEDSSKSQLVPR